MRLIVIALLVALATGLGQASVLQGGDENTTVVLFGANRMPNLADESGETEILKLDAGLMGADNATYQLLDADNNIIEPYKYRPLTSGRQLVYFRIPTDSLFKLVNVTPEAGKSFYFNWWATPKGSSSKAIVRYYGISDWLINDDEQGIVVQVSVQNNHTGNITVAPENFTLFDQWGWPYHPTAGFEPMVIAPGAGKDDRVLIGFTGVSLLSRPAALAYEYNTADQVVIDFEKDYVPLTDDVVYGSAAASADNATAAGSLSSAATETSSAADGTQAAVAPAEAASSTASDTSGSSLSIKDQLAASRARLNDTKQNLASQTSESTATTPSTRDDI
jgi:hypothetical protein